VIEATVEEAAERKPQAERLRVKAEHPEPARKAAVKATERFAVRLAPAGAGRTVPGFGEEFDESALRVKSRAKLVVGSKVLISFQAPRSMTDAYAGMRCRFPAEVVGVRQAQSDELRFELLLKWGRPLSALVADAAAARGRRLGVLLFAFLAVILWSRQSSFFYFWYDPLFNLYAIAIGLYFFSRFFLGLFHRPPAYKGYEPTISVIVSVRNEKKAIAGTVASCYAADYAAGKREVIVVDDGSTDGTAEVLAEVKRRTPELKVYSIPPSGKRAAMTKGIRAAAGEIVVVVDSDTTLDPMALRHIVCGFEDPTLGASAGFTAVANADKNLLTRMQDVRYLVSYELMKAPESLFSAVTCCPGCLSAYRREYLMRILDAWLNQTFLGARATFGDDRSLTNYILRDYRVIYNPLARSTTLVPETWTRYMRQQCRWKKSWLREAPIAGVILAHKHPVAALSFYASAVCSLMSPFMVFVYFWRGHGQQTMGYLGGMAILGLLMSLYAVWKRPTTYWYVTWFWIGTQILLMGPQTYYAILTMRKNHWGTR